jgi:predicted transcriptional regulator
LTLLESKGLIDEISKDQKRKHYCVTAQGRELLGYYSGLNELVQV